MNLSARLARAEAMVVPKDADRFARVFDVVAAKADHEAAIELARQHGYGARDFLIIRSVVSPAGQEPYRKPPYMLHMPQEARP